MSEGGVNLTVSVLSFPDSDTTKQQGVWIARRLLDLAEFAKIELRAIGAGQHQHGVDQPKQGRSLGAVVTDAVNAVGSISTPPRNCS